MSDMSRNTSSGRGSSAADKAKSVTRDVQGKTDSLAQEASSQFDDIKDKAREVADRTRGQAAELVGAVKDRAFDAIDEQKNAGADRVAGVAEAMRGAADELGEQVPFAADYVREAAEGVERWSSSLRDQSIDDILQGVTRFARQQPIAFFGAAVLVGFAATRFLKSSAERQARTQTRGRQRARRDDATSSYPWESEPPASRPGRTYASAGGETVNRGGRGSGTGR